MYHCQEVLGGWSGGSAPCAGEPARRVVKFVEVRIPFSDECHQLVQKVVDRDFGVRITNGEGSNTRGGGRCLHQDEVKAFELFVPIMRVAAAGEQLEPLMSVDECRSPARGISVLPEMVILGTGIRSEEHTSELQ